MLSSSYTTRWRTDPLASSTAAAQLVVPLFKTPSAEAPSQLTFTLAPTTRETKRPARSDSTTSASTATLKTLTLLLLLPRSHPPALLYLPLLLPALLSRPPSLPLLRHRPLRPLHADSTAVRLAALRLLSRLLLPSPTALCLLTPLECLLPLLSLQSS
jgi:hypothetical protein